MILKWIFYFHRLFKIKHWCSKDTKSQKGMERKCPFLVHPGFATLPLLIHWGREREPEIARNHICLSTVHPIRAVIISVFEALMAALPVKIMGPIIFNELHQEVSMGLLSLEQRHIGKQHCFLVIRMAVSLCEAKERPFSLSVPLDLKGPRKAV